MLAIEVGAFAKQSIKKAFVKNSLICMGLIELSCILSFIIFPFILLNRFLANSHIIYWLVHAIAVWVSILLGTVMSPSDKRKPS